MYGMWTYSVHTHVWNVDILSTYTCTECGHTLCSSIVCLGSNGDLQLYRTIWDSYRGAGTPLGPLGIATGVQYCYSCMSCSDSYNYVYMFPRPLSPTNLFSLNLLWVWHSGCGLGMKLLILCVCEAYLRHLPCFQVDNPNRMVISVGNEQGLPLRVHAQATWF